MVGDFGKQPTELYPPHNIQQPSVMWTQVSGIHHHLLDGAEDGAQHQRPYGDKSPEDVLSIATADPWPTSRATGHLQRCCHVFHPLHITVWFGAATTQDKHK